jgi:hypothetical protein
MKKTVTPVVSGSSRTATPLGAAWELTITPSGFEKPVESTWYFSTAVETVRITRKGSRGARGRAVLGAIIHLLVGEESILIWRIKYVN